MDPALPARLCLSPHRSLLVLGPGSRRIGLDPHHGVDVDGLHPALATMLDELAGAAAGAVDPVAVHSVAVDSARLTATATARGAPPGSAAGLLHRLVGSGSVVDTRAVQRRAGRRTHSAVLVVGGGPLAAGVVTGLVQAGVGAVHVEAAGPVRAADLGTGLVDADRGDDRGAALAAAAARLVPGTVVGPPSQRLVPDLVVFADAQAPEPRAAARLLEAGVAHLLVRLRDGTGVVGPLVLPGRTACLRCLDLRRSERDPGWPAVAAQLVGRPGRADPACAAATAAFGTAQALAGIDGTAEPAVLDATIELDVTAGTARRRSWAPHPECSCGAAPVHGGPRHPRATCAAPAPGGTLVS
ncbi:TOMM precursor leader peptide-binding protein [Pseudonocardia sp.]|uniref:TOMM precursor leader peptide-binding protein n=1 Tax=Pseudonocardia sp. TaxID=60912 RepID=UPI00261D0B59|nr:TOMM precursor leader peptide-binding protein [Pseudonocardia sp.]